MCFKKKEPIRLNKKEKNQNLELIKALAKTPEFWTMIFVAMIFIILIAFAIKESSSYMVYNRGL